MPYGVKSEGPTKWVVYNKRTGKAVATHPTKLRADKQLKALYANVKD